MATTTAHGESRDNRAIAILEVIVVAALVLGIMFLFVGDAGDSILVVNSAPDAPAVYAESAVQP